MVMEFQKLSYEPRGEERRFTSEQMAEKEKSELYEAEFSRFHFNVKRGDLVGVSGFPVRSLITRMLLIVQFFTVVGIGMVLEPPQQETGSTYFYGVEENLLK
ncbi:hypothetical protein OROMI_018808 [Orobanche minor]